MTKTSTLKELLNQKSILRIVGAHNALGAKLIERHGFEGIWASGLEISAAHGVPDANILTMTENLEDAQIINDATKLPVICDCDTGYGNASNVIHMVRKYEAAGLAAVVIEDKRFPKVNSFIPGRQELAPIDEFCGKIEAARNARKNPDFCIFARIEALIAGWGLDEALKRSDAYEEAGADGIVIHSKSKTPDEIFMFAEKRRGKLPLIAIPTTYYQVTADELAAHGFKIVIYANHGLRASLYAMNQIIGEIARTGSTKSVENKIASLNDVFDIQGMADIGEDEKKFSGKEPIRAIIPAASDYRSQPDLRELLGNQPLSMLEIAGKTLLDRQMDLLRSAGATDICVIGGYQSSQLKVKGAQIITNPDYEHSSTAQSIMYAEQHFGSKCIITYSDIMFDRSILEQLLESTHDFTIVIDRAFQTLPERSKKLDLVIVEKTKTPSGARNLEPELFHRVLKIGKQLDQRKASHEFIGVTFFKKKGGVELSKRWKEALAKFKGKPFYEADSVEKAGFTDLIQYLIDCEFPIHALEINHGWSEIHSASDIERINTYFRNPSQEHASKK